ncbi:iron complex transport system substrate-binding protein [Luteimicrobium subarcticum]|uniref:Iron complex transport system substrate-binding protein n=1 Tax=Luteimicrobium subarcticum TaxID=620910 RepID=A0A2M8WU46_9MICO|nr:iron complex transport system substrate-binding protein [Luteimicrobium subarcticum]
MRHGVAVVAALSVLGLAACTSGSSAPSGPTSPAAGAAADAGPRTTYPVDLDNCGTKVSFEAAPTRVVTIKSSTTEMMLALGLGSKIVGTAFLDGPIPKNLVSQANQAVASPLSDKVPASEAVLALQPDLVYAGWESNVTAQGAGDRATLAKLGVNTYVSPSACQETGYQPDPLTYDDVFGEIQEVGKVFDVQGRAAALVAQQKKELAAIRPDTRGLTALWWSSGDDTPYVGGDIGAPAMILKQVGLTNVAAGVHATWTPLGWESIVAADPDVMVLVDASWNTAQAKIDFLESNAATKNLTAVKEHRFVVLPFASTEAGVRNVDATRTLAADLAKLGAP